MDGNKFPAGIVVTSTDLQAGELERTAHLLQRATDLGGPGIVSGLRATAASTLYVSVSRGWGYTPRGDIVEVNADTTSVPGSTGSFDFTADAVNYLCLRYEEADDPTSVRAHITSGVSLATMRQRVKSNFYWITKIAYDLLGSDTAGPTGLETALGASTSANLNQSNLLILATVLGPGDNATNFTTASHIRQQPLPTAPGNYHVTWPAARTVTGVSFVSFSSDTVAGTGSLALAVTGIGTYTLTWTAPGDSGTSAASSITLHTPPQTITLTSANGRTCDVEVTTSLLPPYIGVSHTYTDSIVVGLVYSSDTTGRVSGAIDRAHRNLHSNYVSSTASAHGDTASGPVVFPQGVVHGDANSLASAVAALAPEVLSLARAAVSEPTLLWQGEIQDISLVTQKVRLYLIPISVTRPQLALVINAFWTSATWQYDTTFSTPYAALLTFAAEGLSLRFYSGATGWATSDFQTVSASTSLHTSTAALISLGSGYLASANDAIRARLEQSRSSATSRTLALHFPSTSGGLRVYLGYSAGSDYVELTSNAKWDPIGPEWNFDDDTKDAIKLKWQAGVLSILGYGAVAAPWADNLWAPQVSLDIQNGVAIPERTTGQGTKQSTLSPTKVSRAWGSLVLQSNGVAGTVGLRAGHNVDDTSISYLGATGAFYVSFLGGHAYDAATMSITFGVNQPLLYTDITAIPGGPTANCLVQPVIVAQSSTGFVFKLLNGSGQVIDLDTGGWYGGPAAAQLIINFDVYAYGA